MSAPNNIILYHYTASPYAQRITSYLALRGLSYAQCKQPVYPPRPDIDDLGVQYRRIPIMSIGKDVYCDTRLILRKLEEKFPNGALGSKKSDEKGIERLLDRLMTDAGIFNRAAQTIPTKGGAFDDPKFLEDRSKFSGREWTKDAQDKGRPEALVYLRDGFDLLENTLLADGRDWILKTEKPSLADIEAVWPFQWVVGMKVAIPPEVASAVTHPKVFAWIKRFGEAVKAASKSLEIVTLKGPDATKFVTNSLHAEYSGVVDSNDPLKLEQGTEVEVFPIDSGFGHKDRGRLLKLTRQEVVIAIKSKSGSDVHVHMPRWGFRIKPVDGAKI